MNKLPHPKYLMAEYFIYDVLPGVMNFTLLSPGFVMNVLVYVDIPVMSGFKELVHGELGFTLSSSYV